MKIFRPGMRPIVTDEDEINETPVAVAEAPPSLSVEEAMKAARARAGIPETELIDNATARTPLVDPETRTLDGGIVVDREGKTVVPANEGSPDANTPPAGTIDLEALRAAALEADLLK